MTDERTNVRPGRPRRAAKKAAQTTIYVDMDTLDTIDEIASRDGVSRSEWINRAIREKMDRDGVKITDEG